MELFSAIFKVSYQYFLASVRFSGKLRHFSIYLGFLPSRLQSVLNVCEKFRNSTCPGLELDIFWKQISLKLFVKWSKKFEIFLKIMQFFDFSQIYKMELFQNSYLELAIVRKLVFGKILYYLASGLKFSSLKNHPVLRFALDFHQCFIIKLE